LSVQQPSGGSGSRASCRYLRTPLQGGQSSQDPADWTLNIGDAARQASWLDPKLRRKDNLPAMRPLEGDELLLCQAEPVHRGNVVVADSGVVSGIKDAAALAG
jgi:hypothetical protein